MLKLERDGIVPDEPGTIGPVKQIEELKEKGFPLAYAQFRPLQLLANVSKLRRA